MTASAYSGWAGLDLVPLPHESSYGYLGRFAWLNVLTPKMLTWLGEGSSEKFCTLGIDVKVKPARDWMDEAFRVAKCDALDNLGRYCRHTRHLFRHDLTFCPICLEDAYHTHWFGLLALDHCPLHGCRLVQCCQSCEAPLAAYPSAYPTYRCMRCGGWISGAPFSMEGHLQLRDHAADIKAAFDDFDQWVTKVNTHFRKIFAGYPEELKYEGPFGRGGTTWSDACYAEIENVVPLPAGCCLPLCSPLPRLVWRIRLVEHSRNRRRRRWIERTSGPGKVYLTIARRIENWLDHQRIERLSQHETFRREDAKWILRTHILAIAYFLFRQFLENSATYTAPLCNRQLKDVPPCSLPLGGHQTLATWKIVLWATFANAIAMARRAKARGNLHELDPDIWLPAAATAIKSQGAHSAGVIALHHTGMLPFDPGFERRQRRLQESVDLEGTWGS